MPTKTYSYEHFPEEIEKAAAKIRKKWDADTELSRRVTRSGPLQLQHGIDVIVRRRGRVCFEHNDDQADRVLRAQEDTAWRYD